MSRTLELLESTVSRRTRWHFVVLTHEDGRAVGECSDSGDPAALADWLQRAAAELVGRDLVGEREDVLDGLRSLVAATEPERRFAAATGLGGLEQLLLDLGAQHRGEPLWKWLDSAAPAPIPVYANINRMPGDRAPETVGAMAASAVAAGFAAVKCAPFDVPVTGRTLAEVGLERIRAVRRAVGDDVALQVDCHERLPFEEVRALLPAFEELGLAWLEDAVAIGRVDQLAELRAATTLTLAGGETMFAPEDAASAVERDLVDVLMPDVKHAGGIAQVLRIAQAAPRLAVSPHNPSGPVATAASGQLFGACSNATVLEYAFGEVPWRADLVGGHERVTDGHLHLDDRPGLGVELDTTHPSVRVLWSAPV
jgi:galactonate dehydratase